MPFGYWWTVAVISWGVLCALTRWRRFGSLSAIPALIVSELPFIVGYLLVASTVLALADGDLGSPGGLAGAAVALLALAGLVVVVGRALCADATLGLTGKPRRPWALVHGQNDMRVSAPGVRAFAERVRAVSSHPVIYAELPGAYHDFDLYESIRSAAVSQAVEQFTDQSAVRPAAPAGS
jgi:acetyl esterase/lipase